MRFRDYMFFVAFIILFVGTSFLLCIPFAIFYNEPLEPFFTSTTILLISGVLIYVFSGKKPVTITSNRERVILITLLWAILILAGTLPYFISKTIPSVIDIFFETISGMTTTGSSILSNPADLPKSILFWRSLTHWLGGMATIISLITIVPALNIGGYKLLSREEKIAHKFSFRIVWIVLIYCTMTLSQVLLLCLGGMNLFESLCHSFGTVSTGSFSPRIDSIAGYSPYIQYIMALFMFLSGFSYLVYFLVITGKFKKALTIDESRIYFIVFASVSLLMTGILYFKVGKGFDTALRESVFQIASFVSSSGYYNTSYLLWPSHILPLVYLLIFIGGSSSSASGGIKMSRFLIIIRNFRQQFKIPAISSKAFTVKYNGSNIDQNTNLSILTFVTVFGFVFVLGTILLSLFGIELEKCVFLSISALSTFGHNTGLSDFSAAGKIILSMMMIVGRLEIYPLLLLLVPLFYKTPDHIIDEILE